MNNKINDVICASIFLIFGIVLMILTPIMTSPMKMDSLGSRFFPYAIGVFTIIVSLILGISSLLSIRKNMDQVKGYNPHLHDNLRAVLYCIALLVSVWLIEAVHFLAGAFVMTTSLLLLCSERKILWYLIVYACTAVAYFAFTMLLNVRI